MGKERGWQNMRGKRAFSGISRDAVKYMAAAAMVPNHIANALMEPGSILRELMLDVGYFTAITMCFFLVEGYGYTRSKKKYGQRLLLFAAISQIPYYLAFGYLQMNMMFTLFLCLVILWIREQPWPKERKTVLTALITAVSLFSDWALFAPLFTIMFAWCREAQGEERRSRTLRVYGLSTLLFALFNYNPALPAGEAVLRAALSAAGIVGSGAVILLVYNGRKAKWAGKITKWFFYIFYPAHLLALGVVKIWMIT